MTKKIFTQIAQIGIVVDDLDAYIERYKEYGIEPWTEMFIDSDSTNSMSVHDQEIDFSFKLGICEALGVQIELIQPLDAYSDYALFLKNHRPGIHHLYLATDNFAETRGFIQSRIGEKTVVATTSDAFDVLYLDLTKELGFVAEIVDHK